MERPVFFMRKKENELQIDWKHFYLGVLALVIPMALQNLINVGVTAADVVMLGRVGETALSGSSLAGQVQYIMTLFLFGLTSGATVLTAQYWGKKDLRTIEKILGLGMRAAVFVTALFFLAAQIMPEQLLRIFTSEPEVIKEGVKYLRIVSFSYIFMGITQTYLYIMRSVERVVVATVVYLCSLLCNITINAILIFGLLGMPAMGVQGGGNWNAGFQAPGDGTGMCVLESVEQRYQVQDRLLFKTEHVLNMDFLKYAFPVILNEVLWGLGTATNTAVLGHMGSAAVAANSVAQVARQLATVVAFGLSSATAIYLAKPLERKSMSMQKHMQRGSYGSV